MVKLGKEKNSSDKSPLMWIRVLLFINGAIWLILSYRSFTVPDLGYGLPGESVFLLSAMMGVNGVILVGLGWILIKPIRWVQLAAFGYVSLNAILSVTDQAGIFDFLVLFLNLALIALMIFNLRMSPKVGGDS